MRFAGKPLDYAFFLLSKKDYTRSELRKKLESKGYEEKEIGDVLKKLEDLGFLNDLRFAQRWIELRARNKPISKKAMALELKKKGMDEGLIGEAMMRLEEEGNLPSDFDMAKSLAISRMKRMKGCKRDVVLRRLYGMLARKGFPPDVIMDVLKEITVEIDGGSALENIKGD